MGPSPAGKKKLLTEINMVPFIDIVLVLLIIFMIMSPFLTQSQLGINLPKTVSSRPSDEESPIKIQVTKDGDFYLAGKRVLRNDLLEKLKIALAESVQKAVLIEADRDVSFKNVVLALDAAEQAKAVKVGVGVESLPPPETTEPAPVP